MEHHLSLGPSVKVRVVNMETMKTELMPVGGLLGKVSFVYNFYGELKRVWVEEGQSESKYLVGAQSGETLQFGTGTQLLLRKHGEAEYKRTLLTDLNAPCFVRMPQKKTQQPPEVADMLDFDDKVGTFLSPPDVSAMVRALESVGSCGIMVKRDDTTLRVFIDRNRPVCYASKVLNGNFTLDISATMTDLAHRGLIQPWKMFGQAVIDETEKTGVIFEGNCVFNDMPLMNAREIKKPGLVFNVHLEDPNTPVECQWFCM